MSQRGDLRARAIKSAVVIQAHVRGWLARLKTDRLKSRLLKKEIEDGLNYLENRFTKAGKKPPKPFLTPEKRKPPRYKKPHSRSQELVKKVVTIQRHVRGYLQRKRFKDLLIDKLLRDQEELFETQIRKVEEGLMSDNGTASPSFQKSSIEMESGRNSVPDERVLRLRSLPMTLEERRQKSATFSPLSYRKVSWKHSEFAFDVYILASIEIQRRYRGYRARKLMGGSFKSIRRKIVKIQRLFRTWKSLRRNQLDLAARLLTKEANILTNTFRSYQHLRSLLLTQDTYGRFAGLLEQVDGVVKKAGIYCDNKQIRTLEARVSDLELANRSLSSDLQASKRQEKDTKTKRLNCYLKALKTIKCQMELSFKSNLEQISGLARNVLKDREDPGNDGLPEDFVELSTRLPDVTHSA